VQEVSPWTQVSTTLASAKKGVDQGIVTVSIDGGPAMEVDLYSATTTWRQTVASLVSPTYSEHTITITCTGRKNAASKGYTINVDAFDVTR
jgi:hypothetical protein